MNTEIATDVFARYGAASRMGMIPIATLVDAETGMRQTYVFAKGAPIAYRHYLTRLIGHMYSTCDGVGLTSDPDSIGEALWSRISLPFVIRKRLVATPAANVVRTLVVESYRERAPREGLGPREQVALFIQEIEENHADSLENPIRVTGLSALLEPLLYTPKWLTADERDDDADRLMAWNTAATTTANKLMNAIRSKTNMLPNAGSRRGRNDRSY